MVLASLLMAGCSQPAPAPSPAAPAASPTASGSSPTASASAKPAATPTQTAKPSAKTVTINAIASWPTNYANCTKYLEWIDTANKASGGLFNIKLLGGPEVVPYMQQVGAAQRGVVDMVMTAGGYYQGDVPEAYAFVLSQLNPMEERKSGFYDTMVQVHKDLGLYYMGRVQAVVPLAYFCYNVQAKTPKELKGLKIRSNPPYDPILKEIGCVPVTMSEPEIFNAMQQKVIDGFLKNISTGFVQMGLHDVTKYIMSTPIYQSPTVVLMNNDVWTKLGDDSRKIMTDTFLKMESTQLDFWAEQNNNEIKKAVAAGTKLIDWSPEDAKWLVDRAFQLGWDITLPKTAKYGAKLKEQSTKK